MLHFGHFRFFPKYLIGTVLLNPQSHEKFNSVYDEYLDADFNEADTRAKIIDKILKDVLGWAEKDIAREYSVNSGFIDYRLNQNGICKLVIEAKRSDDYFLIPPDKNNRYYKISGAISSVRNLISAMILFPG